MFIRHLFKQSSTSCYRQLRISPVPLHLHRLLPLYPIANSLSLIHRRTYADLTRNPRDAEILKICEQIRFIDSKNKYQGVHSLRYILGRYDHETYHLVCVNPHVTEEPPTCKLISKEQLEEDERAAYLAKKAKKHSSKDPSKVVKMIEISWATAPNDLDHKLKKMTQFLQKGNRVEVILGIKKGMAKQPLSKMQDLANHIRDQGVNYGREWKPAEGTIGIQYVIYFEGTRPKVESKPVEQGGLQETKPVEVESTKPVEESKAIE